MSWMKRFAEAIGSNTGEDQGTEFTATVNSVDDDGKAYVCMAGDSRPVPAVRTAVMVSPGDTVRGKLVKGRFTIEGNLSDNAVGSTHLEKAKEHVLESAHASLKVLDDKIEMSVEDLENGMKSSITETAEEIRAEVEATYLSKEDAEEDYLSQEDAIEVYASKSLVSQTAQSITSQVATTYVNKNDAEQTYATKSSLEQTSTALMAIIDDAVAETKQLWYAKSNTTAPNKPTSKVTTTEDTNGKWTTVFPTYNSSYKNYFYCYQYELISGSVLWSDVIRDAEAAQRTADSAQTAADNANALATTLSTYIRMVSGYGLLVTYTGYTVGALVKSGGSFDIVKLTWSDGVPTIGKTVFTSGNPNTQSAYDSGGSIDFYPSNPYHTYIEGYRISGNNGYAHLGLHAKRGPNSTYKVDVDMTENSANSSIELGVYKEESGIFWMKGGLVATKDGTTIYGPLTLDSALPIASGGTGANTKAGALGNLMGSNNVGNTNRPIYWTGSAFSAMGGELAVSYGGTGASDASTARSNLGIFPTAYTSDQNFVGTAELSSNNIWGNVGSQWFDAGTWLIIARLSFKPPSGNDSARWCGAYVGQKDADHSNVMASSFNNSNTQWVVVEVTTLEKISGSGGYIYANAKKSGSTQTVTASFRAIRLY